MTFLAKIFSNLQSYKKQLAKMHHEKLETTVQNGKTKTRPIYTAFLIKDTACTYSHTHSTSYKKRFIRNESGTSPIFVRFKERTSHFLK